MKKYIWAMLFIYSFYMAMYSATLGMYDWMFFFEVILVLSTTCITKEIIKFKPNKTT